MFRVLRLTICMFLSVCCLAAATGVSGAAASSFVAFESGQVRPLALSPGGDTLYAVTTPDNQLEVFDIRGSALRHRFSIPVGMEPVAGALMIVAAVLPALPGTMQERRFERNTLRRLLPVFGLYLLVLALGLLFRSPGSWHAFFGLTDRATDKSLYLLNSRVEYLAAFTVLGYLVAEWRGRLELSISRDLPHLLLIATGIAATFETINGFQAGYGASLIRFLPATAGAGFGGTIYHLSRAHIWYLLGR